MVTYGEPDEFEVIWRSGGIDRFRAHQVTHQGGMFGDPSPRRVMFHGEINGKWRMILSALEDDIVTIRNVTHCLEQP